MFVYRVVLLGNPETTIVDQSTSAYQWLRDAEIAAVDEVPEVTPFGVKLTWEKNGKGFCAHLPSYRLEITELVNAEITTIEPF